MRRLLPLLLVLLPLAALVDAQSARPSQEPKLVLLIAIDQFRYDYLTRFRDEYSGGIKTLLEEGADFVDAELQHYPTVTAVGHSTMLSGATPAISGIIGNDWYERASSREPTKGEVTSVYDPQAKLLGPPAEALKPYQDPDEVEFDDLPASPRRLLVSTVGDELKRSGSPNSKVFGVSMKDRSAILMAGRMADGAFWFHQGTGLFVTSDYYAPALPQWVEKFNQSKAPEQFAGRTWLEPRDGATQRTIPQEPGAGQNESIYKSPFGNDLLESFTEELVRQKKLGQRGVTDLLAVSFSSNDSVGHEYGPDSPEAHAVSLGVDQSIGRLFEFLDQSIGMRNVLVVVTADHAVSPMPELLAQQKMPGGRIRGDFFAPARRALEARFGPGNWIEGTAGSSPYLNYELIDQKGLERSDVERVAAEAFRKVPHVARVYTRRQILDGRPAYDPIDARVLRSFNPRRSGDLEVVLDPYWIRSAEPDDFDATHGSPYNYDAHIPLIFMGPGIKPGRYYQPAALNDLAPTLSALLNIETPSGSVGRILAEIIEH